MRSRFRRRFDPDRLHCPQPLSLKGFRVSRLLLAGKALHVDSTCLALRQARLDRDPSSLFTACP